MVVGSCVVLILLFLFHSTELRVYNNAKIDCNQGRYVQKMNKVTGLMAWKSHFLIDTKLGRQSSPIQQASNKWSLNAFKASRFSGDQNAVSLVSGRSDGITNGATSSTIMPTKLDSKVINIKSGIF